MPPNQFKSKRLWSNFSYFIFVSRTKHSTAQENIIIHHRNNEERKPWWWQQIRPHTLNSLWRLWGFKLAGSKEFSLWSFFLTAAEKEEKRGAIKTLFVYVFFVKLHRFETIKKHRHLHYWFFSFLKWTILPFSFFNERFSIENKERKNL